jgi:hypothetical protein
MKSLYSIINKVAFGPVWQSYIDSDYPKLIKKKEYFPHSLGNSEGTGAKSYFTNDLLIYGENSCAFSYIIGSPSSYMTLHPIPSEFPYI